MPSGKAGTLTMLVGSATLSSTNGIVGNSGTDSFLLSGTGNVTALDVGAGTTTPAGNNTARTWSITAANAGTLTDANGSQTFANIHSLVGNSDTDSFVLSGTGHVTALDGGAGADNTLTGNNIASTWSITAANAGTLTDAGGAQTFANIQSLQGNSAADSFVLTTTAATVSFLDGGAGTNTLTGSNTASTWSITAADAGTLTTGAGSQTFSSIQSLVGNSAADSFVLSGTGNVTALDGGAGTNTLAGNNTASTWSITAANAGTLTDANGSQTFAGTGNVTALDGGTGQNTLTGKNIASTWSITGANAGTLTDAGGAQTFASIQSLQGGTGADSFVLTATTSTVAFVDGGGAAGLNTLTGSNTAATWSITAANAGTLTTGAGSQLFSSIQSLVGNSGTDSFVLSGTGNVTALDGGAGTNTLAGNNTASTWSITAANAGTLTDANGAQTFAGIQSLIGNSGTDSFVLSGTGNVTALDGGAGQNTLTGKNIASTWSITGVNAGTLTDAGGSQTFASIQSLQGGTGADSFVLTATTSTVAFLDGGGAAGLNTLTGSNTASTWSITAANAGTLTTGAGSQTFSSIQSLVGNSAADSFVLSGTGNVTALDGGAGTNTLAGNNTASTWSITAANAGTLTDANGSQTFAGIQSLIGNSGTDSFVLSGTGHVTALDGGAGADNTLTGKNISSTWSITGANAGTLTDAGGSQTFASIQSLQGGTGADSFVLTATTSTVAFVDGGGAAGLNTLAGSNTASTWSITAANAGTLTTGAGSQTFSSIQSLVGNSAADSFVLSGTGNVTALDGGAGTNTLAGNNTASTWSITAANAGTLTDAGGAQTFANIQSLQGNSAADSFVLT